MSFVEFPDSFPALWESPYLYYLLQASKASVLGSTHILTLRFLSKLSSTVWWEPIPLPHRLLNDVLFQGSRVCVLIHQLSLMPKDVWVWIALLLSFLSLFSCCSLRNPGDVVTRLPLVFHLVQSGVPTQFKTIWFQFNVIPLTYYSSVSLTASCRKLLCWTAPCLKRHMTHICTWRTHTCVCSSEQSLPLGKFACQLFITGVSLLSRGPSVSWCRTNNSSLPLVAKCCSLTWIRSFHATSSIMFLA